MTKTLKFQIDNTITTEITIMFTFDKPSGDRGVKQVVYRVLNLEGPMKTAAVRYNLDKFVFSAVQIERGGEIPEQARVAIVRGERTSLIRGPESQSDVMFTDPILGSRPNFFQCTNETEYSQDIAFGFPDEPLLVWPKVGHGASVIENFQPILTAYDAAEYEEGQVLTREIENIGLFKQDLTGLPDTQSFIISRGPDGLLTIKPADTA